MEAAENGVLSLGEIFSNEATVSDLDHLPEGPWAPSDAREAQRINGKSVTSPRQGMVSQACKRLACLVRTYYPRPLVVRRWHVTREGSTVGVQFDPTLGKR